MKKIILFALLSSLFICFANKADAKIRIPISFGGEKISTVVDLPNDSTTMTNDGYYGNIGCYYKQFSIIWIPIWNWDEQYCIEYEGTTNMYGGKISKEQAEAYASHYGVKLASASPSFWNKIGGKLIVLAAIAFFIWSSIGKKKEDDEEETISSASNEDKAE